MAVRITKNTMSASIGKITAKLDKLPNDAFKFWYKITPIKSGNAKRRTRLQGNKIKANYNYAVPLDQGKSRQAPKGMSAPTEEYIEKRLRGIIRK